MMKLKIQKMSIEFEKIQMKISLRMILNWIVRLVALILILEDDLKILIDKILF